MWGEQLGQVKKNLRGRSEKTKGWSIISAIADDGGYGGGGGGGCL